MRRDSRAVRIALTLTLPLCHWKPEHKGFFARRSRDWVGQSGRIGSSVPETTDNCRLSLCIDLIISMSLTVTVCLEPPKYIVLAALESRTLQCCFHGVALDLYADVKEYEWQKSTVYKQRTSDGNAVLDMKRLYVEIDVSFICKTEIGLQSEHK